MPFIKPYVAPCEGRDRISMPTHTLTVVGAGCLLVRARQFLRMEKDGKTAPNPKTNE